MKKLSMLVNFTLRKVLWNKICELEKQFPNDQEFGEKAREFTKLWKS